MRTRALTVGLFSLFVAVGACQPPGQEAGQEAASAELSEADVAAIRDVAASYREAMLANDWQAIGALYTEDAIQLPEHAPAVEGRQAIVAANEEEGFQVSAFENPPVHVEGRGDLAYIRGTYDITFSMSGMMEPMDDEGKYVVILRKGMDGSWRVAVEIWNSDLPLPGMGEEMEQMAEE